MHYFQNIRRLLEAKFLDPNQGLCPWTTLEDGSSRTLTLPTPGKNPAGAMFPSAASVASLGWVTPGAATEGVTPLFFPEKSGDLFIFCKKLTTFFAHHCHYHYHFLLLSLGCHPLVGSTDLRAAISLCESTPPSESFAV